MVDDQSISKIGIAIGVVLIALPVLALIESRSFIANYFSKPIELTETDVVDLEKHDSLQGKKIRVKLPSARDDGIREYLYTTQNARSQEVSKTGMVGLLSAGSLEIPVVRDELYLDEDFEGALVLADKELRSDLRNIFELDSYDSKFTKHCLDDSVFRTGSPYWGILFAVISIIVGWRVLKTEFAPLREAKDLEREGERMLESLNTGED